MSLSAIKQNSYMHISSKTNQYQEIDLRVVKSEPIDNIAEYKQFNVANEVIDAGFSYNLDFASSKEDTWTSVICKPEKDNLAEYVVGNIKDTNIALNCDEQIKTKLTRWHRRKNDPEFRRKAQEHNRKSIAKKQAWIASLPQEQQDLVKLAQRQKTAEAYAAYFRKHKDSERFKIKKYMAAKKYKQKRKSQEEAQMKNMTEAEKEQYIADKKAFNRKNNQQAKLRKEERIRNMSESDRQKFLEEQQTKRKLSWHKSSKKASEKIKLKMRDMSEAEKEAIKIKRREKRREYRKKTIAKSPKNKM